MFLNPAAGGMVDGKIYPLYAAERRHAGDQRRAFYGAQAKDRCEAFCRVQHRRQGEGRPERAGFCMQTELRLAGPEAESPFGNPAFDGHGKTKKSRRNEK